MWIQRSLKACVTVTSVNNQSSPQHAGLPTGVALYLASSSVYRRELLERLALPFDCHSPDIDEQRLSGEDPHAYVQRLAKEKARTVAHAQPAAWVIGSDQTAVLGDDILGKPGSEDNAVAQLKACAGKTVRFLTSLCLWTPGQIQLMVDTTEVEFRDLNEDEIRRYVAREQPLNCAGSFKVEGYGISLFKAVRSQDPTALIGLPLIALCQQLRQAGAQLP